MSRTFLRCPICRQPLAAKQHGWFIIYPEQIQGQRYSEKFGVLKLFCKCGGSRAIQRDKHSMQRERFEAGEQQAS